MMCCPFIDLNTVTKTGNKLYYPTTPLFSCNFIDHYTALALFSYRLKSFKSIKFNSPIQPINFNFGPHEKTLQPHVHAHYDRPCNPIIHSNVKLWTT